MFGIMLAIAAQAEAPVPAPGVPPLVTPPTVTTSDAAPTALPDDWASLPELRLQRRSPDLRGVSSYVRDEVRAGRCTAAGNRLRVDLVVQVAASGQVRRIRPHAIGCPTVEQYASGLMLRMARSNVSPADQDRWYRTQIVFAWQ